MRKEGVFTIIYIYICMFLVVDKEEGYLRVVWCGGVSQAKEEESQEEWCVWWGPISTNILI